MKKALSVFLSLLMVITTISVVFTLPASAVTSTAFSQDFESYNVGDAPANGYTAAWKVYDEGAGGYFKGGLPTATGWMATTTAVASGSLVTTDGDTLTTGNTSKYLSLGDWAGIGMTIDVLPNTTYTLTYKQYAQVANNADQSAEMHVYDVTGLQEGISFKTSTLAAYDNTALTRLAYNRATPSPAQTWNNRSFTFTTGATANKVLLYFHTDAPNGFYLDDILLTYDAKPTVKAETYGKATKNGGVAWVDTDVSGEVAEGTAITYKAMPYDSALFDGWYVDGVKVSTETTLTRNWAVSEKVVAKFEALSENLWPEPSFEGYKSVTTGADITAAANLLYRGGGKNYDHQANYNAETLPYQYVEGTESVVYRSISQDNWTATSYGRVAIVDSAWINNAFSGVTAYSGKQVMTFGNKNGHGSFKVIEGLETNTTYTLSYWVYADVADSFNNTTNNYMDNVVGAPTNENGEVVYSYMSDSSINTTTTYGGGQTTLATQTIVSNNADDVVNQWVKYERTFNTGDFTAVLVPFYPGSTATYVMVDHVTLYEEPTATTPTINITSNLGTAEGVVDGVTDVYYNGDTFTATAKPYDNATFDGWYVDDVKVSSNPTETLTYDETKPVTAKFSALTANLFDKASFEEYTSAVGGTISGGTATGTIVWGAWDTLTQTPTADGWIGTNYGRSYAADNTLLNTLSSGAYAYSGEKAMVHKTGSHLVGKVVNVTPGKDYKLVYYSYSTVASALTKDKTVVLGLTADTVALSGTAGSAHDLVRDGSVDGQTEITITRESFDNTTTGKWVRQVATFNSGDFSKVLVTFGNGSTDGLFIDHVSLFEVPTAFTPTITVDDGGNNAGFVTVNNDVYLDGDKFEVTAYTYDTATFDGWYVNGEKVATTKTATLTYNEGSTYEAKYVAQYKNILTDSSYENVANDTNLKYNTSFTWGEEAKRNHTIIDFENGVAIDRYALSAKIVNDKAYSGSQSFQYGNGSAGNSHRYYKLISVEPNSTYVVSYYYYQELNNYDEAGFFRNQTNKRVIGLNKAAVIAYGNPDAQTGESADAAILTTDTGNGYFAEVAGRQVHLDTEIVGDFSVAGEWTKITLTIKTGDYDVIGVPFCYYVTSNKDENKVELSTAPGVYVDNLTAYKLPKPTTVSIGVAGGNLLVNGKYVNNASYEVGEQVTVTAEPYVNTGNTFLGWYTEASCTGEAVSTNATLSVTATDGATYFAKFKNNNIVADPGFENFTIGEITSQTSTTGFGKIGTANLYVTDTVEGYDSLSTYAGNQMLKVHANNATIYYNAGAVKPYTSYKVSFKVLLPEEGQEVADWRVTGGVRNVEFAGVRAIDARSTNDSRPDITPINANQYDFETNIITYHTISEGDNGTWKQVTAIINSNEYNELMVGFGYYGTTNGDHSINMYVDDFTVVELINATASVETVDPFGDETDLAAGGYAYAKNSYTQAALPGSGEKTLVTLVATANPGNTFLGWYLGETLVSANTTCEVEISESVNYVAKFATNGFEDVVNAASNLLTFDGSFEEYSVGSQVIGIRVLGEGEDADSYAAGKSTFAPRFDRGSEFYTLGAASEWGRIYATSRYAYDGNNSLYFNSNCNASFVMKLGESGTETALETNTKYVLSFYYMIPKAAIGSNDKPTYYIQQIGVVEEGFDLKGVAGVATYFDSKEDANGKKLLYGAYHESQTVFGEWTKVEIPFTTTAETAGATFSLTAVSGAKNSEQFIYIDNFELKKAEVYDAAAQTAFDNSLERGGVAIRAAGTDANGNEIPQALRFKARIAKDRFEAMTLGADYTIVEYGTLAMNAAYIEGSTAIEKANNLVIDYTNGGKTVNKGVSYNAKDGTNKVFGYKEGKNDLIFTAALTGIGKGKYGQELADAYRLQFVVRTYAIIELADGTQIVVYDNVDESDASYCASIYDVASYAVDNDSSLDANTRAYLEEIVSLCKNYPEATPEGGVASSYSVLYNPSTLANETAIENFFINDKVFITGDKGTHANSRPTYYTSGAAIRCYAGNTLTLTTAEGYYIESVVIGTTEDYPYGNATTSTGVATTEGLATTVTGINSSTFVITTPAQTRITSILVNYKYGEAPDPVYPDTGDDNDGDNTTDGNTTVISPADLGFTNAANVKNVEIGSIVLNGGEGTNTNGDVPKYYSSDNTIRAYAGNTLTFTAETAATYDLRSAATAKNIESIEITYKSGYADENATVNVGTITTDGTVATITGINNKEVTITFTKTVRILSIKVITEDIEPCETHTYTNDCDVDCDVCGAVRDDAPHAFVSDCDTTCDCGATREATADHTADACATACELCGEAVVPTHKFAGDCDTTCECGATQVPTADHNYVDGACSVCGAIEPVSCSHEYDNDCDPDCNICFAVREDLTHTFASDCDTVCEYCDATREALAEHTYTYVCSTECSACGFTREADHDFTNGDCECGEPKPTTTTVDIVAADHNSGDATDVGTVTVDKVTLVGDKGTHSSGTTPKYYNSGTAYRFYTGNTLTMSVPAGYTIKTVVITAVSTSYNYGTANVLSSGTATTNGTVTTISNVNASELVISVKTSNQLRITDIQVIYDVVAPCETHTYTNNCDADCDVCGEIRDVTHNDQVLCDTVCSTCGATVEATADHTYTDNCDTDCDNCGATREAIHDDNVLCDTKCSNCGATVVATADHTYTDNCDADCDNCGATREDIPHKWTDDYDAECDCGETRTPPASCEHENADACDTECGTCGATLVPAHKFAGACDTTCDCGATREATADHTYADDCDEECNVCGATRVAPHQFKYACSSTCVCGETRTPADHTYVDGFCECGEAKPTSTQVSIGAANMGIANSVAMGTYTSGLVTLVGDKGSNSSGNVPKFYTSGGNTIRIYAGNTITISVPDGYIIEVIALVCSEGYLATSAMGSNYTSTNGTVVTFDQIGASTWVFTNTGSDQVRIVEFMVMYKEAIVCDHVYDNNCDAECNLCFEVRAITHEDNDILCDTMCAGCGAMIEATADHVYDDDNDANCNKCGFERILASECEHEFDNGCDADCNICDFVREVADHVYDDACDTNCNECDAGREITHADSVLCDEICSNCGETVAATAEHSYVDGVCENCNAEEPAVKEPTLVATFTLAADGTASHVDGSSGTTYSEENGDYKLSITGGTSMYTAARDAKGNGCIKLGTSSKTGGFTFTVAEDVQKVVIYVAKYKANATKVDINGTQYTLENNSNDGDYDAIEIDTSKNKTITLTTVSGGVRAMVNTIEFYA